MTNKLDSKLYSTLDMNITNHILSYCSDSVRAKINKSEYNLVAPIAINKIIKAIQYNRNRMNMIMENELPMSDNLIRAHYILHYPDEYRHDYCLGAVNNIMRMENDIAAFIKGILNINEVNQKKIFKQMIMQMSVDTIIINGW